MDPRSCLTAVSQELQWQTWRIGGFDDPYTCHGPPSNSVLLYHENVSAIDSHDTFGELLCVTTSADPNECGSVDLLFICARNLLQARQLMGVAPCRCFGVQLQNIGRGIRI